LYSPGERRDLLIRDSRLGSALAFKFVRANRVAVSRLLCRLDEEAWLHDARKDIETAVYRAIYAKVNAGVQTNAMLLRSALPPGIEAKFELGPLTGDMCHGCLKMNEGTQDKPWKLWAAEVEKSSLNINRG
jgi:hypothetical protein